MIYKKDPKLTEKQNNIKWIIYCELEFQEDKDIIEALESVLSDMKEVIN